jgi:hypothetical protein
MEKELAELTEKTNKLEEFMIGEKFDSLLHSKKLMMREQFRIMNSYIKVLKSRLNLEVRDV